MTDLRKDHFFEMSLVGEDLENVRLCVEQGIDSRLTAFTKSEFSYSNGRLFCWIHPQEMEILIRRLLELGTEDAETLADNIVFVEWDVETF